MCRKKLMKSFLINFHALLGKQIFSRELRPLIVFLKAVNYSPCHSSVASPNYLLKEIYMTASGILFHIAITYIKKIKIFSLCFYLVSFRSYLGPFSFNCKVLFKTLACLKPLIGFGISKSGCVLNCKVLVSW